MIPYEEIDERLKRLGKSRKWLAETTGRSIGAIRSALAPGSGGRYRSPLLQKSLSNAITNEEDRQSQKSIELQSQRITVECSREQFRKWNKAALVCGLLIEDWAIESLDKMAEELEKTSSQKPVSGKTSASSIKPKAPSAIRKKHSA